MKLWPDVTDYSPSRLFCLDLLRGLDMFFLTVFAPFVNWYVFKVWTPPKWLHLLMNHSETAFAPRRTDARGDELRKGTRWVRDHRLDRSCGRSIPD